MNSSTKTAILMMAQADTTVTANELTALEKFLNRGNVPEKKKLITGKMARQILGQAEGRLVSRPYLRSLVAQGRLHPVRQSPRKVRYEEKEVMDVANEK